MLKKLGIVFIICCLICPALAQEEPPTMLERYLATGDTPSLYGAYEDLFSIGAAITPALIENEKAAEIIKRNFNSVTCENEMKADFVLDYQATLKNADETRAALNMARADKVLKFAKENGISVRAHALVWHSQVPRWFFTEGYQTGAEAPYVSRETMLKRMENYIRDVMDCVNTNYPGVVYAWDVVNEGIDPADKHEKGYRTSKNPWYDIFGDDFITLAFTYARQYAAPEQKLFYNDYNCYEGNKLQFIRPMLKELLESGLVDGIGMQSHIGMTYPTLLNYEAAMAAYGALGIEIQVTELDIKSEDNTIKGQMALAVLYNRYFTLFHRLKEDGKANITNVTVWGVTDDKSWLSNKEHTYYPLLFNADFSPKLAYFGAIRDASIPLSPTEESLTRAIEGLNAPWSDCEEE